MLLVTLVDVAIRREVDIDALILHHLGRCRACTCVSVIVVQRKKERARGMLWDCGREEGWLSRRENELVSVSE